MYKYYLYSMTYMIVFGLTILLIIPITCNEELKEKQVQLSRKELYKYGFNLKRSEQIEGVKRILMMEDVNKRSSMVKILLDKIFKVVAKAKILVEESGYVPGNEFPENQLHLDALGNVFENVALFGDLLLRCPDITHELYDKNTEWRVTMNWGVVFSNESGLFDDSNEKFLNLVAQELEILPRDPNYINPYKEASIKAARKKKEAEEEEKKRKENESKNKEKARKKKKKKGPRLGGTSTEL